MEEYLRLIQPIIPGFTAGDMAKTFSELDIDSMDLVVLRVTFEKKFGSIIPASVWLNITKVSQIIEYYDNIH